jgi:ABC-type transporter MlaC component
MIRRAFFFVTVLGAFLLGMALTPAVAQTVDAKSAASFVTLMVDDFFGTFAGKKLSRDDRARCLDSLIERYTNMSKMSEALLGRSWGRASETEQLQFQQTLIAYMLAMWSSSMSEVSPGSKITVTEAQSRGDVAIVRSLASSPGDDPTPVEWLVGSSGDGRLFVADVNVSGISMIRVMKSDFTSVLFANSGRLGSLIAGMRQKIKAVNVN